MWYNKIMSKFLKIFKSRTVWAAVILFVINGVDGIRESIEPSWLTTIDAILGILVVYFRANPRVDFDK